MSDTPDFKSKLPPHLLDKLTESEKWLYNETSIQRQQNDFIIERLKVGEKRMDASDLARQDLHVEIADVSNRLKEIEKLKDRLASRWSLIVVVLSAIVGPVILSALGAFFLSWFEKKRQ